MRKQVNYCDDPNDEQFNNLMVEEGESSNQNKGKRGRARRNQKSDANADLSAKGGSEGNDDNFDDGLDQDGDQEEVYM